MTDAFRWCTGRPLLWTLWLHEKPRRPPPAPPRARRRHSASWGAVGAVIERVRVVNAGAPSGPPRRDTRRPAQGRRPVRGHQQGDRRDGAYLRIARKPRCPPCPRISVVRGLRHRGDPSGRPHDFAHRRASTATTGVDFQAGGWTRRNTRDGKRRRAGRATPSRPVRETPTDARWATRGGAPGGGGGGAGRQASALPRASRRPAHSTADRPSPSRPAERPASADRADGTPFRRRDGRAPFRRRASGWRDDVTFPFAPDPMPGVCGSVTSPFSTAGPSARPPTDGPEQGKMAQPVSHPAVAVEAPAGPVRRCAVRRRRRPGRSPSPRACRTGASGAVPSRRSAPGASPACSARGGRGRGGAPSPRRSARRRRG